MLAKTIHMRWVSKTFLLIYFLLSTSAANASFWCQDAELAPHLESSPVGKCLTSCFTATDNCSLSSTAQQTSVIVSKPTEKCFDSPAHLSAIISTTHKTQRGKVAVVDLNSIHALFAPHKDLSTTQTNERKTSPLLPQKQALAALRTLILRH